MSWHLDGNLYSQIVHAPKIILTESQNIFQGEKSNNKGFGTLSSTKSMNKEIKNQCQISDFLIWSDAECKQMKDHFYT